MSLKARDVDRVCDKLDMCVKHGRDRWAYFYYQGKCITRTRRSLGKSKIDNNVRHQIRQQLKLDENEFTEIVGCTLKLPDYVDILRKKKLID